MYTYFYILACQKGALTFGNLNSFVLLNVSSLKEVKFKFRSLKSNIGSMIAAIQIPSQGDLTVGVTLVLHGNCSSSAFHFVLFSLLETCLRCFCIAILTTYTVGTTTPRKISRYSKIFRIIHDLVS